MSHSRDRRKKCTRFWVGKLEVKSLLERPIRRWQGGVKMDIREIGCGVWSGSSWLRTGTGGGLLRTR
jgi:hypothetical protein